MPAQPARLDHAARGAVRPVGPVALADSLKRKGQSPMLVLMTDGRANICRDGKSSRARALEEAVAAGRNARAGGVCALAIDTSPAFGAQYDSPTLKVAQAMDARYVRLPYANAAGLSEAVRAAAPTQ
jgi:magnesium chelatase subunit D